MAELKTRKIKYMTRMGKVAAYGPLLATSGLLASQIVGKPWLNEYTLAAALGSLLWHGHSKNTKNPKFGRVTNSTFDAILLETGIITGLLLFLGSHPRSYMGTDSLWKGEGVPSIFEIESIQNLPGFAPPSFDQAYGGQA